VATATLFDTAANSLRRFIWLWRHYKNQHGGTAGPAFIVSRCSFFFFSKQIFVDPSQKDKKNSPCKQFLMLGWLSWFTEQHPNAFLFYLYRIIYHIYHTVFINSSMNPATDCCSFRCLGPNLFFINQLSISSKPSEDYFFSLIDCIVLCFFSLALARIQPYAALCNGLHRHLNSRHGKAC